jgi:hypothetical protein
MLWRRHTNLIPFRNYINMQVGTGLGDSGKQWTPSSLCTKRRINKSASIRVRNKSLITKYASTEEMLVLYCSFVLMLHIFRRKRTTVLIVWHNCILSACLQLAAASSCHTSSTTSRTVHKKRAKKYLRADQHKSIDHRRSRTRKRMPGVPRGAWGRRALRWGGRGDGNGEGRSGREAMQAGGGGAWGVLLRPPFPDGSRLDRFDPLAVTYVALENCSSTIL